MRAAETYGYAYGPTPGYPYPFVPQQGWGPRGPGYFQPPWGGPQGTWDHQSVGRDPGLPLLRSQNAAEKALRALQTAGPGGPGHTKSANKMPPAVQPPITKPDRGELIAVNTELIRGAVTHQRADQAKSDSAKDDKDRRYVGKIRRFDPLNGYGFIQCHETYRTYGRDVFLNQAMSGGVPAPGTLVSFNIIVNEKGQPQARDCTLEEQPKASSSNGATADGSKAAAVDAFNMPAHNPILGKMYKGRIKSFNPGNGFGFIECQELKRHFYRDVFLHGNQMPEGGGIGMEVEFTVNFNKNQQPQARDIRLAQGRATPGTVYDPLTHDPYDGLEWNLVG